MRIGITGAFGLIGWHLRCLCRIYDDLEIIAAGRETFSASNELKGFVAGCDAIVHLAGMNRGYDALVESTNIQLAEDLVKALESTGNNPHLLFSSSTHVDRDTAYGRSKRAASALMGNWALRAGGRFTNLVLPHVFGEQGKPFYNSVVSTFAYQLAKGELPRIDNDGQLELLHAHEVARLILKCVRAGTVGEIRPQGYRMRVSELLEKLSAMADSYGRGIIPSLEEAIDLALFNTYRSYLFPEYYPVLLKKHTDDRGSLVEAVKTIQGGQAFFSTTRPGITRGEHFHFSKVERFLVVQGEAVIRLRRLFDDEIVEFHVNGEAPGYVDIPPLHTHNITNTGSGELLTLFWAHEIFDPEAPDTFGLPVSVDQDNCI